MTQSFSRVPKHSLSDQLAQRIRFMIQEGKFTLGDRLPPIMELARRFGVGHPTAREALKKLEALGVVEIRHGSGVYVTRNQEVLVLASPGYIGTVTRQLLVDLVRARRPLEMQSVADAATNATPEDLDAMRRLLASAGEHLDDGDALDKMNMAFHRQIAVASGNAVLLQLLDVLRGLFAAEQRRIIDLVGSREDDHREHLGILAALEQRDGALAVDRMRRHLDGVEEAILKWDPVRHPVG